MIDYGLLAGAQEYYQAHGYKYIEVPWMVSPNCDDITRPEDIEPMKIGYNGKHLIASGEQGFLYLRMKGYIPADAKLCTITPCFRNESQDNTHQKMFMKCELIQFVENNNMKIEEYCKIMEDVRTDAFEFFKLYVNEPKELYYVNTTGPQIHSCRTLCSYDIMYNGFELGSYGVRQYHDITWIYGTGIAEPRFSKINSITVKNG